MGRNSSSTLAILVVTGLIATSRTVVADVSGLLQQHSTMRTNTDACELKHCDVPYSEIRAQVKADYSWPQTAHTFTGTFEVVQDFVFGDAQARARELYWDWTSQKVQTRTGRQLITWGTGDMLFINDVFAKDWNAFFSGMPMDFMKRPIDAIKLDVYHGDTSIEAVMSRFTADHSPEFRRFDVDMPGFIGPTMDRSANDKLEYAAKVSRSFFGWDVSAYASRGYWHSMAYQPVGDGTGIMAFNPRLNNFGASLTGPVQSGVLNLEAGHYDSNEDASGTNPFVQNGQTRLLAGYSRQYWDDSTIGVQFYVEHMDNYQAFQANAPYSESGKPKWNKAATLRLTQYLMHQTLTLNVFQYWGLSESDRFLQTTLRYAFNDDVWAEIGTTIFSGDQRGMFGMFDRNDNVFLTVRYAY